MIEFPDISDVLTNTSESEKEEFLATPLDRDFMSVLLQAYERRDLEQNAEIKCLKAQLALFNSQNQALHNCWQSAISYHIAATAETRAWIAKAASKDSELAKLRRLVEELKGHLNPKEEATLHATDII